MSTLSRHVSAPRGAAITCKGWPQEAALRMLMNNLDPEVAAEGAHLMLTTDSRRRARHRSRHARKDSNLETYDRVVKLNLQKSLLDFYGADALQRSARDQFRNRLDVG